MTAAPCPPPFWLAAAEPFRALAELATLPFASPMLASAPHGDGHAVLVLPGFIASDAATLLLRQYLIGLGYDTNAWELGRNLGWKSIGRESERLVARLAAIQARSGGKVTLIGWSLGGVMARHVARLAPNHVRQIISLGSPITGDAGATTVAGLYERISGDRVTDPFMRRILALSSTPPPVPATAIYSETDGIVPGANCREPDTRTSDNIAVVGSHVGLVVNPLVLYAIADRLALPENGWTRFDRSGWRSLVYPAT